MPRHHHRLQTNPNFSPRNPSRRTIQRRHRHPRQQPSSSTHHTPPPKLCDENARNPRSPRFACSSWRFGWWLVVDESVVEIVRQCCWRNDDLAGARVKMVKIGDRGIARDRVGWWHENEGEMRSGVHVSRGGLDTQMTDARCQAKRIRKSDSGRQVSADERTLVFYVGRKTLSFHKSTPFSACNLSSKL
ncbi:hypothetical protein LR48_Vigan10g018200 [Vigna angularis]|uniref:Uncharacterized protein n=1 Tax=Phaseolus angularis TaxID=3914 RepID=A0A0L9VGU1_PHAAN|nr:hypothetical protein LR48_Vigan10g018200 [Vigna angularis]